MNKHNLTAALLSAFLVIGMSSTATATPPNKMPTETDDATPPDTGTVPGLSTLSVISPAATAPTSPDAATMGAFGPVLSWPIVAIHAALLPDGRVISFGTGTGGYQGGFTFDVWTPGSDSHLVLPNTTANDVFCAGQTVLSDGRLLTVGGDLTINGQRNWSNDSSVLYSTADNSMFAGPTMLYARWYPTVVPQTNGEQLVLGGREEGPSDLVPATTPEVFNPATGWRTLTGAFSDAAFGAGNNNWYYPRAWLTPRGNVFVLGNDGRMWSVTTGGSGTITTISTTSKSGTPAYPAVMYRPGKVMSLRNNNVTLVDTTVNPPVAGTTATPNDTNRVWSTMTVLPDGNVLLVGGSQVSNQLTGVAYDAETWHPNTGTWTTGASMTKPRLYHSTAILLPDASVLVAGGGAPGPVRNLNAEIYYPAYLYNASGNPAARPSVSGIPASLISGQQFSLGVTAGNVAKVALIHSGADTHSFDAGQRYVPLAFSQSGTSVTATVPGNGNIVPSGWYMLFVVMVSGVPSTATIVHVN